MQNSNIYNFDVGIDFEKKIKMVTTAKNCFYLSYFDVYFDC